MELQVLGKIVRIPRMCWFDRLGQFSQSDRMGNTFCHLFRISTWGESHGGGIGVVVDGCPPKLELSEKDIQPDLDRRRPGESRIVSPRKELDKVLTKVRIDLSKTEAEDEETDEEDFLT